LDIIADLINGASADDRLRWEKLICFLFVGFGIWVDLFVGFGIWVDLCRVRWGIGVLD